MLWLQFVDSRDNVLQHFLADGLVDVGMFNRRKDNRIFLWFQIFIKKSFEKCSFSGQ